MPFYKRSNDRLLVAPTHVRGPGIDLHYVQRNGYTYPVDGWYWFDTLDEAMATIPPLEAGLVVSMRQARLALLGAGLLPTVEAAIAALPGVEGDAARIEWEYASVVARNSGLVPQMGIALGLTEQQLDGLFIAARQL